MDEDGPIIMGSFLREKYFRNTADESISPEGGIPSGTEYATRSGEKGVVVGFTLHTTHYPFYGHIIRGEGKIHRTTWSQTGRNGYHDDVDTPDDLIMPGAPELDWSKLPAWANYFAVATARGGGVAGKWPWMWFAEKPTLEMINNQPSWTPSSDLFGAIPHEFAPEWVGEIAVSLGIRPGLHVSTVNWRNLPRDAVYVAFSHDFASGRRCWMWFEHRPELHCDNNGIHWTSRGRCGYVPDASVPSWAGDAQHSLMTRYKS